MPPRNLNLSARLRCAVSFTPRPFDPPRKEPRYTVYRRLDGPQSLYGRCGKEKNPALSGIEAAVVQPIAESLQWLSYRGSFFGSKPDTLHVILLN
jgi:hypothetical protein